MNIPKINIVAIGSAIGLAIFWGWQPLVSYITGDFNENLIVQIVSESIETCKPEKLLVLHIQPMNKGQVPVEIGGKKKGSMVVTVKRFPDNLVKDKWVDPKTLPTISEMDILKEHPDGYIVDKNVDYDEVETIPLLPGIYWAGVVLTFNDGNYVDQSIVVKLADEPCSNQKRK